MIDYYENPFFSVVIPTYNRKHELEKALESVFDQTERSFEVIVVDDHSEDGTIEWLQKLNDPRLKVFSNKKTKGACGARNTGIEIANSEWIAFLDSDDHWKNNKLEIIKNIIVAQPQYSVIYSSCNYTHKNNLWHPFDRLDKTGDVKPYLIRKNRIGGVSLLVVKKQLLDKINGFDETLPARQDVDLYLRLADKEKFLFVPDRLVDMNFDSSNRISDNVNNRLYGWVKWYNKHQPDFKFIDRLYHQKLIFALAWKAKKIGMVIQFFPGAISSVFADLGLSMKKSFLHSSKI